MRTLIAFTKKEFTQQLRSGRLLMLGILFFLFGVMNPAVAKLTPWLLEMMADTLAESGMNVTEVTVSAMDSWVQFYKNIPMALIAFVLLENNIFTREYASGTLVLSLTKGLERYKVVVSKTVVLSLLWTAGYWLCFAVTYVYNAYYWDNSVAQSLMLSVVCWWLFGMLTVALTVLFSTLGKTGTVVLMGTGGVILGCYLLSLVPKISKYLPTYLTGGTSLIYGTTEPKEYVAATVITAAACVLCFALSILAFNKKQL